MKKKISKQTVAYIGLFLLIALGMIGFFAAVWYKSVYGDVGFDAVIYALTSDAGSVESKLMLTYIMRGLLPAVILTPTVFYFLFFFPLKKDKQETKGRRTLLPHKIAVFVSALLVISLITTGAIYSGLVKWAYLSLNETDIYANEYVDPDTVDIKFPEKKRNLIYIYLESMETTFLSQDLDGAIENNVIPELYSLAENNINFSHNDAVGGGRTVSGTTWTVGALVAHSSGLPLKFKIDLNGSVDGGQYDNFLPGVTTITDLLKKQGYYQTFMFGSDGEYGGRKQFFEQHGIDKVYDLFTAYDDEIVPRGYWEWWGMEDKYLIEYAKQELLEISQKDQPFSIGMLTVDTHHISGYLCSDCENKYEAQYDNVLSCSSKRIAEFIDWIKQQDFYENTTIVITGDHCSMDEGYVNKYVGKDYVRRVYNCIINPAPSLKIANTKNREFATIDMYPTTLAALGCQIKGDRLAMGTNLFSGEKTICEKYDFEELCDELSKYSEFYEEEFMEVE